jgi:hypothetical protein
MKQHRYIFFSWLWAATMLTAGAPMAALAQGCVVARGTGVSPVHAEFDEGAAAVAGRIQTSVSYRYLNSDRHFVGSEEQKERGREGSQVINQSHFIDIAFTYAFDERFSATLTVPFADHDRSSVVRRNDPQRTILQRYHTQNSGLADLRLMGNGWLLDPKTHTQGNVLLGIGVDLPTGNDDAEDTFATYDSATGRIVGVKRTVDQSIQLGDGGWGVLFDVYAYRRILPRLSVFANGFYAVTPQQTSGVPTFRGNPFEAVMSIADSYMVRAGVEYLVWPRYSMTFSLGGRIEGVPVHDLVGGSDGFRRPGYAVSVEPGLSARFGAMSANLYAPLAVYRNRQRSVADQRLTETSGIYRHGDAAFADGLVMFSVSRAF